jgi:2-(1,2-epoxy-1,2-dihydrophenyl)acetyl-CoA isomerase
MVPLFEMERNMEFQDLLFEKSQAVATITLNRPDRLNALGTRTTFEIVNAAQDAIEDPDIRVIIITGAGEAFCAGGDHRDIFQPGFEKTTLEWRHRIRTGANRLLTLFNSSEKPVIAAINGIAVGGGCTIALACDIRIASAKAKFGLVFSKIGATPEFGCTYLLPRIIGLGKALELLYTADIIDAQTAAAIGLVNKVVPHEELKTAVRNFANQLLEKPPAALGMVKSLVYKSLSNDLLTQLEMEAFAISTAFKTQEHQEAVKAFLEKKKPVSHDLKK